MTADHLVNQGYRNRLYLISPTIDTKKLFLYSYPPKVAVRRHLNFNKPIYLFLGIIKMSKQMTLSSFIKVSNKRPLLTTTTEDYPKKVKNDSLETSDNKSDITSCSTTDGNNRSTPSKDGPHKMRLELIDWNKKFPVISKNIGLTWYPALWPEFSKPYFSEVFFICLSISFVIF